MQVFIYRNAKGVEPFEKWLKGIRDRISRIEEFGALGDYKRVSEEIYELRFHFAAGYRVYFCYVSQKQILVLCGGDKSSQKADIIKAKNILEVLKND